MIPWEICLIIQNGYFQNIARRPTLTLENCSQSTKFNSLSSHMDITCSWWRSLSYRNQSIDLFCKSIDWFLYDRGLRCDRVKVALLQRCYKACSRTLIANIFIIWKHVNWFAKQINSLDFLWWKPLALMASLPFLLLLPCGCFR